MSAMVHVTHVEVLSHYRLRVSFDDGLVRDVDLGYLRDRGPIFEPLQDPDFFAQVAVDPESRSVVWPNGADLDPLVLHGDFEPASSGQIA
jgi:hypothetical protein